MPFLIAIFARWGLTGPFARVMGYIVPAALAALAVWGLWASLTSTWMHKGAAQNEARHVAAHTAEVAINRADEQHAQAATDRIVTRYVHADEATTTALRNRIKELNDAIAAVPAPVAGAQPPAYDTGRVSASLNAGVDRANRAAALADAAP